ncbi:Uu.00g082630.m01.CDS01 [Anthostomella pinea]|uniref:Uu.00g082630.m01.CDS01 n=1 Tax=Anthostomella pinea TaxID=933095 RepID=A0AAI8VM36_9PEZI|nr:Uu.00g082630.m01.CDS01 [Anthostomella pinea]
MPSQGSNQSSGSNPSQGSTPSEGSTPKPIIGVDKASKDAGHRNFHTFLLSYNLRIYNDEDVQEGRAILKAMGYNVR